MTTQEARNEYRRGFYAAHHEAMLEKRRAFTAAHKTELAKRRLAYNASRREEACLYTRDYRAEHSQEIQTKQRIYRETHRDLLRAQSLEYERANREKRRLKCRLYQQKRRIMSPDVVKAIDADHQNRRRTQKRGLETTGHISVVEWRAIKAAYRQCCAYCGAQSKKLTQDHVIPLSRGGKHEISNIVPACMDCNLRKGINPPNIQEGLKVLML